MAHITEVVGSEWSAVATPGQGPVQHAPRRLNHLQAVEAESIHILREAVAEFARPVMLYSIGKDSSLTDLLFRLVLAVIGSALHWSFGSISMPILFQLLLGGVPGVLFGCLLAQKVPANKLKTAVAMVAIFAGLQLVWTGTRTLAARRATNTAKISGSVGIGHAR
jgi:hypothetical protein